MFVIYYSQFIVDYAPDYEEMKNCLMSDCTWVYTKGAFDFTFSSVNVFIPAVD